MGIAREIDNTCVMVDRPIIIGGCPRSGTTLLRSCLNAHPSIYAGPECAYGLKAIEAVLSTDKHIGQRAARAFGLGDDEILRSYGLGWEYWLSCVLERNGDGKTRIADKMPQYQRHFGMMSYMLPDALFIHIIRDPRDVAASLFDRSDLFGYDNGDDVEFCKDASKAAEYWSHETSLGIRMRTHENSLRYMEVYYEDLALSPEATLASILKFVGEPWSESVLEPDDGGIEWTNGKTNEKPHSHSVGNWRRRISQQDAKTIEDQTAQMMKRLGYGRTFCEMAARG